MTEPSGVFAALFIIALIVRVERLEQAFNLIPGKWNR